MHTDTTVLEVHSKKSHDPQYGRRVEIDRSWTVYHVFTGVPADAGCGVMTGLSRADATEKMMSLNRHRGSER